MLEYALEKLKEHNSGGRVNVYAVLTTKRGLILSEGGNLYLKSHPVVKHYANVTRQHDNKCFLHAEIRTLIAYRGKHKHLKLYVASKDRNGNVRNAKPCPICSAYIDDMQRTQNMKIDVFFTES